MRAENTIMRHVLVVLLTVLLGACSAASPEQGAAAQASASAGAAAATASPTAPAAAAAVKAVAVAASNPLYEFDYAYPAQAAAIPALGKWLDADLAKQRAELVKNARIGQAEAKRSGFDYHPYSHATQWAVVTDLPGWLSLSAQRYEYAGGAHGNPWRDALVWDKAAGRRLKASDLFASPAAVSAAIRAPFCAALDQQRAAKRGGAANAAAGDPFTACIDPVASTLILGSADNAHFTRIGVLVGPYEAGPYSEGNYEVTLPVTAAVLGAVKPQYRNAFAAAR